ncbi:hypothetical protein [Cellulomonas marina]|uniref:Uncharacterized protein n=1 Tax=Cellulomonas marina TaxID=988821 RepID=A0A1I0Y656_9CELL|nr:hypothetical protein [Cellulomonas marina]GIG29794.1 hypothetical protein Cma02nite_23940 [Cellulomonas marina]SFB08236.1 hypothetical protein SAMN05421867_106177 [Cellulomonas marina]
MTAVLIHPSQGKGDGLVNADVSLKNPVVWADRPDLLPTLVADQRMALQRRYETEARIWGTYRANLPKYKKVTEGDLVVFTGGGGIWALGRIGYQFSNDRFAAALWTPDEEKGLYEFQYAVEDYRPVELPYALLSEALGHKAKSTFQAMVVYEGERADTVVQALTAATGSATDD